MSLLTLLTANAAEKNSAFMDPIEHYRKGEIRGSLSWDNISAMEDNVLKFGLSGGVHITNGIEIGAEQQFIVPPDNRTESRSWAYIRAVPFRDWVVSPFIALRAGYYNRAKKHAGAIGTVLGATAFLDKHIAFEINVFTQGIFESLASLDSIESQTEFDCRFVIFY